jgi:hypothetical protein
MLSRREILLAPAALLTPRAAQAQSGKMTLAMHQNTSARAGFRGSLEGWAKAGIKDASSTALAGSTPVGPYRPPAPTWK